MIYDAWESDDSDEHIRLAETALKLDKNCADAYIILAELKAESPKESLEFYVKGIEAGKRSLGRDFEKFKGHFWGFHETRPFMRAMAGYSETLWYEEERSKSIDVIKEMLELNPEDNQGMRHILITRLLILNRLPEAEKLYNEYKDDVSAQWHYSIAYLYFNKKSKRAYADNALRSALKYNPYVPLYLFGLVDMPDKMPDYVGIGDKNEAVYYATEAMELWAENEEAMKWFVEIYRKMKDNLDKQIEKRERDLKERFGDRFDE